MSFTVTHWPRLSGLSFSVSAWGETQWRTTATRKQRQRYWVQPWDKRGGLIVRATMTKLQGKCFKYTTVTERKLQKNINPLNQVRTCFWLIINPSIYQQALLCELFTSNKSLYLIKKDKKRFVAFAADFPLSTYPQKQTPPIHLRSEWKSEWLYCVLIIKYSKKDRYVAKQFS